MIHRVAGRALLGAAAVVCVWLLWPRPPVSGRQPEPIPAPADSAPRYVGVSSCAAMACHHFNGAKGAPRSEYSTWSAWDKHANAFKVLYNDRSERIVKNLYGTRAKAATETALCLKCHATNDGKTANAGPRFQVADGIGCESCHGPAERYLSVHFQAGFKQKSIEEKARHGLWPTKDLTFRAKLCTTCHVGDGGKEVNHDLIAAGHPRLNFELAGYHGIWNKHWPHSEELRRHPDFEARLWAVGQLVSAKAALELLKARAEGAVKEEAKTPWPEFAEYDCFACHKHLKADSPRQKAGYGDRLPGAFPWGTWYLTLARPYGAKIGELGPMPGIVDLKKEMESPTPRPAQVIDETDKAIRTLDGWLNKLNNREPFTAAEMSQLSAALIGPDTADRINAINAMSWDEAAQLWLAEAALHQGATDLRDVPRQDARKAALTAVRARLKEAFPKGYDSPSGYNPLDPTPTLGEQFLEIRKLIGN